jgi:hypothetical protein
MKTTVALLLAACGTESAGEIDLVLENQSAAAIVVQNATACGTRHVQILDASGLPVDWRCGDIGTTLRGIAIEDAAFAPRDPITCAETVRRISPSASLVTRWNGLSFGDDACDAASDGPFVAQFCFGSRTSTRASATTGQMESIVTDLRCERVSFQLGVDLEARHVVR